MATTLFDTPVGNELDALKTDIAALNTKITPVSVALTSNDHIRYTKSGSVVTISFWWATKAEMTAMTMPEGLRPQRQMYFPATILTGSAYSTGTLAIGTSGSISAISPTSFDNCFSEITYVAFN
jgi:hypothetical protein